jgi:pimeloyl-ACP methyl ester carboxylesterase
MHVTAARYAMTLLTEQLPQYDRELSQSIFVAQPPPVVFRAIHEVRLSEMPLAIFMNKLRYAFAKPDGATFEDATFMEANQCGGWVPLGEVPDREVAAGLVGKFWEKDSAIDRITPEEFAADPPSDRAKLAVDYLLEPVEGGTRLSLNTRVLAPREQAAGRKFKLYFSFIRLGIPLVVGSGLRAIKDHAEHEPSLASPEVPIYVTENNRSNVMATYEERLRQWRTPFEAFFVTTRYGKTHVVASGDPASPPVVLLHPMGGGAFMWPAAFIAALTSKHRVYALDTIGDVGKSQLNDIDRYPRTGRDYSTWLEDVCDALVIASADVVAGSMGGWIAMNHAICAPHRMRRLVLLGPMGLPSWRATLGVLGPMFSNVVRPSEAKLERIIDRALGDGDRANEYRPWMRLIATCRPRLGSPFHISARKLRRIKIPTLVVLGDKDGLIGSATAAAARARENIAHCEIEILPQAGHVMMIDEPEIVGAKTARFLELE